MAEKKNESIEIRVSPSEKDTIQTYCRNEGIVVSQFIRECVFKAINKKKGK